MANENQEKRIGTVQNLGWKDRLIRIVLGTVMVTAPLTVLGMASPIWLDDAMTVSPFLYIVLLAALYPFWTATSGWDPIYSAAGFKTCGDSERNPCGTLPYELDAAMGRHPIPESDVSHTLGSSRHPGDDEQKHAKSGS